MRKKKRLMYPIVCDKCGKNSEIDKENSTENWTVFKMGICECGGKFKIDFDNPYYEERI